jgi:hypothetical protein
VRGRFETTAGTTTTMPWVLPVALSLVALAGSGGRVGSLQLIRDEFDGSIFPVAVVAKARSDELQGNLFSEFTWGGYLVYAWPEQKIFIDGGTDFFGEDLFREYAKIKHLSPGWRGLLEKWQISLLLLKRDEALTHEVTREASWNLLYCDSLAVLLRRSSTVPPSPQSRPDVAEEKLNACGAPASYPLGRHDE